MDKASERRKPGAEATKAWLILRRLPAPQHHHTESQNHRMAWVGRDLKDHESPTPLQGRATNLPIY